MQEGFGGVDEGVVGNEFFVDEGLLKNGVAAVDYLKVAGFVEDRPGVLIELGGFCEGDQDIEGGEGGGGGLEGDEVVGDVGAKGEEFIILEGFGAVVGTEDFAFHFLEGGVMKRSALAMVCLRW